MATLRVAIAGCGRIVQLVHLKALARVPGIVVTAFAEPSESLRGEASRQLPGASACEDYRALLERDDVEAVLVCVPNHRHAEVAAESFAAGKHVYLEKPLAMNLDEGRRVLEAWRASGKVGMIGLNYRFHPLYLDARRQMDAGNIGGLVAMRTAFATPARELPPWKQARQTGGGALLDLASHHVDLARFLSGREVVAAFASLRSLRSEDDTAALDLHLDGGATVQGFFSMGTVDEDRFEIYGDRGKLVVDRHYTPDVESQGTTRDGVRLRRLARSVLAVVSSPVVRRRLLRRYDEPSYASAFAHFASATQGRQSASPDLEDGFRSLEAIAAAEESARTGRLVRLEDRG